jgi:hypothetical protein
MNQEKIDLSIEMPMTGFDPLALRRLSGLVAAHVGLSFEKTPEDSLRFFLGERAPDEAMDCAAFISGLCKTAKLGRTALYCRTAAVDSAAIAKQRTALEGLAVKRGFTDLAYYEDDGYSGNNPKRPAFAQLEQDICAGQIARVLATSVTRLGRNTADVVRWAVWLRRHGAEIVTLDPPVDLNAALEVLENA